MPDRTMVLKDHCKICKEKLGDYLGEDFIVSPHGNVFCIECAGYVTKRSYDELLAKYNRIMDAIRVILFESGSALYAGGEPNDS